MNLDIAAAIKRLKLAPHGLRTSRRRALVDATTRALADELWARTERRRKWREAKRNSRGALKRWGLA